MTHKRRAFQSLLFLSLAIIGKNSLSAQFAGTSYLSAGIGLNIPHTESSISSPKVSYSLSPMVICLMIELLLKYLLVIILYLAVF